MSEKKTKNDIAWEALFNKHNILHHIDKDGFYGIKANAINEEREARLMTKFDHKVNLPYVFSENGLSILPDSRNSYIIGRFQCYAPVDKVNNSQIIPASFPPELQSLSPSDLYSESSALLCAYHAGIIDEVLEEEVKFTIFGRMSTRTFDFGISTKINNSNITKSITIDKAQCEIDGGFEGASSFAILEVKNEEVEDFHVRQLYFPYRLWRNKIEKKIVPVFLTYSNEVFTFSVYEFENPQEYNSLKLVKKQRYQILPTEIRIENIRSLLSTTPIINEAEGVPFPQADRFERIIDLLAHLYVAGGSISYEEITTRYSFTSRQTDYYTNAARYLGLISKPKGSDVSLTETGTEIMRESPQKRNLALVKLILQHRVFRNVLEYYLSHSHCQPADEIAKLLQDVRPELNVNTTERRSQTVKEWIEWIIRLTVES